MERGEDPGLAQSRGRDAMILLHTRCPGRPRTPSSDAVIAQSISGFPVEEGPSGPACRLQHADDAVFKPRLLSKVVSRARSPATSGGFPRWDTCSQGKCLETVCRMHSAAAGLWGTVVGRMGQERPAGLVRRGRLAFESRDGRNRVAPTFVS